MKLITILGVLVLAGVLCYGALICSSMLFGTICGKSLWNSPFVPWTTKAGLLSGCIVPPTAGLYLLVQTAKD